MHCRAALEENSAGWFSQSEPEASFGYSGWMGEVMDVERKSTGRLCTYRHRLQAPRNDRKERVERPGKTRWVERHAGDWSEKWPRPCNERRQWIDGEVGKACCSRYLDSRLTAREGVRSTRV